MTAQLHEELILNGERLTMACAPDLPDRHVRIIETPHWQPESEDEEGIMSTACWRGYRGTWEIRDEKLYLLHLRGRLALSGDDPLFAAWYSGTLHIPRGEMLRYVHMGFASVFEEEIRITVEAGCVTGRDTIDHRGRSDDEDRMIWNELEMGMDDDEDWPA